METMHFNPFSIETPESKIEYQITLGDYRIMRVDPNFFLEVANSLIAQDIGEFGKVVYPYGKYSISITRDIGQRLVPWQGLGEDEKPQIGRHSFTLGASSCMAGIQFLDDQYSSVKIIHRKLPLAEITLMESTPYTICWVSPINGIKYRKLLEEKPARGAYLELPIEDTWDRPKTGIALDRVTKEVIYANYSRLFDHYNYLVESLDFPKYQQI